MKEVRTLYVTAVEFSRMKEIIIQNSGHDNGDKAAILLQHEFGLRPYQSYEVIVDDWSHHEDAAS